MNPFQCNIRVEVSPRVCHRMTHISSGNQDPGSVWIYQTFLKIHHLNLIFFLLRISVDVDSRFTAAPIVSVGSVL